MNHMGLTVQQFSVGGFDKNFSYCIHDTETKDAYIVDPSGDISALFSYISENRLTVTGVCLTHTHADHFDALPELLKQFESLPLPIYVHENGVEEVTQFNTVKPIADFDELKLGTQSIAIRYTPGHTDDAVCYFITEENAADAIPKVLTGDTLFVGGCGRTSERRVKDLYESLAELRTLPPETIVYPGHDYGGTPTSTIAHELATNKYYLADSFPTFAKLRLSV